MTPHSPSVSCASIWKEPLGLQLSRAEKVTVSSTEPRGSSTPDVGKMAKSGRASGTSAAGAPAAAAADAAEAALPGGASLAPGFAPLAFSAAAAANASSAARASRSRSACGMAHCTGSDEREWSVVLRDSLRPMRMRSNSSESAETAMRGAVPIALTSKVTGVGLPLTVQTSVSANEPTRSGEALTRTSMVSSLRSTSVRGSTAKMTAPLASEPSGAGSMPLPLEAGRASALLAGLPPAGAGDASSPPSVGGGGGVKRPTPCLRKEKETSASKSELLEMWKTSRLASA